MKKPDRRHQEPLPYLAVTTHAEPKTIVSGGGTKRLRPVNVCSGGTASCLTARMWKDGWTNYYSLGHFPSTAILVEYD